ncbi:putative myosin xvIII [Fasciola gigantica]|uniref:Putative myosin xvIII n=1 Tax=Fasciola gigantica TaxID=46835 RepID=A0A504YZ10_FASGI|nr:putative myosin xvIII [Fasciola gigantica]
MSSVCMPTENGGHLSPDLNGDSPSISEADANIPVWWSVPDGYKAATLLSTLPNNRCRLLLLPERQEVEADLGDVERANPSSFDRVEDVADLQFPNELSITHTLLQRFGSGQVCTYASGSCLLSINPMTPLNIYSEAVMNLFTGCRHLRDMPPHVFSVAQLVLARLNRSHLKTYHKRNASDGIVTVSQAICLSGRSGSGKTRATLDILSFLLYQSNRVITQWTSNTENQSVPSVCHRVSAERLRALFCMLDAFTCSRVLLNTNANRALRLFSVEYGSLSPRDRDDPGLFICGLTTRLVLFERSRVTERPDGEPNFHIFYYFLAGLDEASRCALFLTDANEPNLFMTKLHRPEDKEAARGYWTQLCHDAELLGFDMDDEWLTGGIARLLAIIYHLGCAGCVEDGIVNGTRADEVDDEDEDSTQPVTTRGFMYMEPAHRAAYLLNCSVEQLSTAVFGRPHTDEGDWSALDCLRGFVQGLYQTVVDTLLMLFNRCLSSHSITGSGTVPVTAQVLLIDPAGIQVPVTKSRNSSGASFPDLIMNYASDRIGKLFHDTTLSLDAERLQAEGLSVRTVSPTSKTAESLVHLLEGSISNHIHSSQQLRLKLPQYRVPLSLFTELMGSARMNVSFIDTPYDLLIDCENVQGDDPNASLALCVVSSVLGVLCAYILPVVCSLGLIGNVLTTALFLHSLRPPTRQMIYFACLALSDAATQLIFGWLWLFPAKGLPYATNGRLSYFTFAQSSALCQLHRFAYSFTSTLSANILLLAATDRCASVYWPLKIVNVPLSYAWYSILLVVLLSALMMLPFGILTRWKEIGGRRTCWIDPSQSALQAYHVLFSNACLVQPICTGLLNLLFLVRIRRLFRTGSCSRVKGSVEQREYSASITLLTLCVIKLVSSLPQSVAYLIAFSLSVSGRPSSESRSPIRMAYNIADIAWNVIFLQITCNIIIYFSQAQRTSHLKSTDFRYIFTDLRTIRRLRKCGLFTLNHSLSSVPVDYQLSNRWLVQCRLSPSSQNAVDLLRRVGVSSLRMFITSLMNQKDYLGPACPTWFNEQSVSAEAKKQMDFVINLLESCAKLHCGPSLHHPGSGFNDGGSGCGLHWIHCLLPVINAGLCQLSSDVTFTGQGLPSTLALGPESRALAPGNLMSSPARICVNLIRAQLRGLNLVTVLHAARAGYTDRVSLTEFRRYYDSLLTSSARESLKGAVDRGEFTDRKFVSELLSSLRYPSRSYLVGKSQVFLRSYVLPQLQLRRSSVKSSAAKGDTSFSSPLHLDTTKNTTITLVASPRSKDVKDTNVAYNSHSQQSRLTVTELKYPDFSRGWAGFDPSAFTPLNRLRHCLRCLSLIDLLVLTPRYAPFETGLHLLLIVPVPSSVERKIGNHTSSPIANTINPIPANKNLQQYLDAKARQDQSLIRANSPAHGPALLSGLISENLETQNSPWSNATRKVNGVHGGTSIRPLDQDSSARSHPINQRSGDQAESKIVGDLRTEQIPTTKQGAPLPQHRQVAAPFTGSNGSTRKCSNLCPQTEILGGVRAFLDEDHNYSTNDESAINEDAYLALKDKFDRAQKVIEQTRQQVEQLTLEIKQKEANIMDLHNQLLDTRNRSNEAQVQLGVVEGNVRTLTNERDRAETVVKSLEKQLAHSNAQISVLQTQLKEANEKMRSLSANLDEQDRLPDKNKLDTNRESESKELTNELVELRQTRQSFMLQLSELRSELEEARQDLTIAEQARSRAEQHLNQLRSESQRLIEEREAELDETRATNHARLRQLEEQLDAAQQELSQATRDRLKLEHELDEARTELFALRDSIDPDTERKLRKELKKCQALLAEKEELCERLIQQPSAEQALIKELRDRIDHLDEEKDAITRQKRALQTELDEAVTQASGLQRLKKEVNSLPNGRTQSTACLFAYEPNWSISALFLAISVFFLSTRYLLVADILVIRCKSKCNCAIVPMHRNRYCYYTV